MIIDKIINIMPKNHFQKDIVDYNDLKFYLNVFKLELFNFLRNNIIYRYLI